MTLLSPDFVRRLNFMFEPLRHARFLPLVPDEREVLLEVARDWLGRFLNLLDEGRSELLGRTLAIPQFDAQDSIAQISASESPIPGWDWQASDNEDKNSPILFDPEFIERTAYLIEQLLAMAEQSFYREAALLAVDRLDLIASLVREELARLAG